MPPVGGCGCPWIQEDGTPSEPQIDKQCVKGTSLELSHIAQAWHAAARSVIDVGDGDEGMAFAWCVCHRHPVARQSWRGTQACRRVDDAHSRFIPFERRVASSCMRCCRRHRWWEVPEPLNTDDFHKQYTRKIFLKDSCLLLGIPDRKYSPLCGQRIGSETRQRVFVLWSGMTGDRRSSESRAKLAWAMPSRVWGRRSQ